MMRRPLEGVTVVDLSWHLAGPFCTMILADLGARVIKVEAPGSHGGYDPIGFTRHYYKGQDAHYMALNRNKESVTLNLKTERGRELLDALVRHGDVLFNNFRPGVMDRLGLSYERMVSVNPSLIYASLSAFGQTGPYRDRPGVDLIIQALSGGMSMTGEPGRPPVRAGIPLADLCGGMWAAIAILSALQARNAGIHRTQSLDIGLLDGQLALIPYFSAYYFLDGLIPGPQGSGGHGPTYSAFECSDKRFVVIAVIDQKLWRKLCSLLQKEEWVDDARFATAKDRDSNRELLKGLIQLEFCRRPSDEWVADLIAADVPAAKVNRLDEALTDPQIRFRNMVVEIDHPLGDTLRFVGNPVRSSEFTPKYDGIPVSGQDTVRVLGDLAGLSESEVQQLHSEGVL